MKENLKKVILKDMEYIITQLNIKFMKVNLKLIIMMELEWNLIQREI